MISKHDAVTIEPQSDHQASIIWLHGLGADGHDFESIVPELRLPNVQHIRFIFPHAPIRAVTINGGMAMRAWYDVQSSDLTEMEDAVSIQESANRVSEYIRMETDAGIANNKIILAGFSQGGAIALYAGLRHSEGLAGILALSTYLPLPGQLSDVATTANQNTPIMMAHGISDTVINIAQGERSYTLLKQYGYPIEWREYDMPHTVCFDEVRMMAKWITQVLG